MYAKAAAFSTAFYCEQNLNTSGKTTSSTDGPKFPGDKSSTTQNNNQQKKGIQVLPDGRVTNIPQGMVTDQFGMIGLLTFIRAAETDPGMVHLALGSDLTTLGLNLNSPDPALQDLQATAANCTVLSVQQIGEVFECTFTCGADCRGTSQYPCVQVYVNNSESNSRALLHSDEHQLLTNPKGSDLLCEVTIAKTEIWDQLPLAHVLIAALPLCALQLCVR
ncbi:hypothetical protein CB1_000400007 [Camelus ferus]|nr:hypothetical protein CB1_000400007 [Camelus ferus]